MKNLKKVLALVVALTMVFTTVAFASYPDVDATADYAGAVELLSAIGVFQGDENGNFNPDNAITRAEFAAIVCRALGLEGSANAAKGATQFTDVAADHWASGYINIAAQTGVINGRGNGIFAPSDNVTFAEAVKMLVVAIGYEPMAAQKGGWPTGYLTVANSVKMTAGVPSSGTDVAATRATVAMLTANAMETPVMDQTAFGTDEKFEPMDDYGTYKSLLTAMDIHVVTGVVVEANEKDDEFTLEFTAYPDDYEFGYRNNGEDIEDFIGTEKVFEIGDSNVAGFVGQNVDVYLLKEGKSDYTAIIAVASGVGETLTVAVSDIDFAKTSAANDAGQYTMEYYETKDANKTTKIYVEDPTVKVNGNIVEVADLSVFGARHASFNFVENSNDKYFDIIDITVYEYGIVEEVLADKERIEFLDGKVSFDSEDDDQIVKIYNAEGAEIALEDIVAGDVLAMVVGDAIDGATPVSAGSFEEKITIYNLGQSSVTGTVTGWSEDDEEFVIDGTSYEYVAGGWVTDDKYADFIANDPLGADGTFYFGMNGKIIGFDGSKGMNGNYAFILRGSLNTAGFEDQFQLKLLTAKEGVVIYNVDTTCEINNVDYVVESDEDDALLQANVLTFAKYERANAALVADRLIEYDLNKQGEIDEIKFVAEYEKDEDGELVLDEDGNPVPDNFANVDGKFDVASSSYKLNSKKLEAETIIFDVDVLDSDNAKVVAISALIDEGEYAGKVFKVDSDNEFDIFVMTSGDAAFAGETKLFVVDSVVSTTYDEDDAKKVSYYAEGDSKLLTAIFTEDSDAVYGDYEDLNKGSIFLANVAEDGFVTDYAVIATMDAAEKAFVTGDLAAAAAAAFGSDFDALEAEDGVEIFVGYIESIENNDVVVAGREIDVTKNAAMYAYNTNGSKAKINVGDWYIKNIDEFDGEAATMVLVKMFENEVTDIISITDRKAVDSVDELIASTHGEVGEGILASADVVEVVDAEIVEEDEIIFE